MSKDQVENVQRTIDSMQAGSDESLLALPALKEVVPYINYIGLIVGSAMARQGWLDGDDATMFGGLVAGGLTLAFRLWVKRRRIVVKVQPHKQ